METSGGNAFPRGNSGFHRALGRSVLRRKFSSGAQPDIALDASRLLERTEGWHKRARRVRPPKG